MEVKLFVNVKQCHASSTINRKRYMYVYMTMKLSYNCHIMNEIREKMRDKMLKRAYNRFIEIRQTTRRIITKRN